MTTAVDSVTGATTTPTAGAGSLQSSTGLDKDSFLKLLVAQISNQDPLSPMEGTEFVTQLSQFAMVEQSIAQSTSLGTLSSQIGGIANNDATSLVGKTVTLRGRALEFDGTNAATTSVNLSGASATTKVDIVDANGNVVRTLDMGSKPAGQMSITWDGKTANGQKAPAGSYTVKVTATDAAGSPVTASQDVTGTVKSIGFDKGYPELVLDSGATGSVADLVSVSQPTTTNTTK